MDVFLLYKSNKILNEFLRQSSIVMDLKAKFYNQAINGYREIDHLKAKVI